MLIQNASAAGYESAWFPAPAMNLTQLAYENASHGNCNAIDLKPGGNVFAPFTGIIKQKNARWGYILLQSLDKVYFADGTLDYMTVGFMHDSNITDLSEGQVITQGTDFYQAGGMGEGNPNQYSAHVDISVFKGKVDHVERFGKGDTYAYNAFFINSAKTTINSSSNFGKAQKSVNYGAPTNWSNLWRYLDTNPTLPTISGQNAPSTLKVGQVFKISGTISSNTNITSVTAGVFTSATSNKMVTGRTVYPNSTSYNLSKLDPYAINEQI